MENKEAQEFVNRVYEYTANLMFEQKKNQFESTCR